MEFLLSIILVWAVIFWLVSGAWKEKEIAVTKKVYLESLAALKRAPTSAETKQRTLALGRTYARLTRDKKGRAVFDEMALMKDINAACAAGNETERAESVEPDGRTAG